VRRHYAKEVAVCLTLWKILALSRAVAQTMQERRKEHKHSSQGVNVCGEKEVLEVEDVLSGSVVPVGLEA
jgi:hypothetical protein